MEILVYVAFCFVVAAFLSHRWFLWLLDIAADDLLNLFYRDEEKWWWEKELPLAIRKSGFLTRAALNLLNEEGRLRKRVVLVNGIRWSPRVGVDYPGMMLLVKLENESGPRKKKERKAVPVKRPVLEQIPVYSTHLNSLNY